MQLYKLGGIFLGSIFLVGMIFWALYGKDVLAMDTVNEKKAILVVSFGTSYPETRKMTIEAVENKIQAEFPDYTIRRAFTSQVIIKKMQQEENLIVDTPRQALEKLRAEGFTSVVVQPLHIIAGQEYEELAKVVHDFRADNSFTNLALGKPVLYSNGETCCGEDDFGLAIQALKEQLPSLEEDEAVVLMGHGTHQAANISYTILQKKLDETGMRVYVGTVEAGPSLDDIQNRLREEKITRVILMPYMLVAGDHAQNDLAGDEDHSWKVQLRQAGYIVDVYMHGLGENPAYQNIYVRNVQAALQQLK